MSSWDDAACAAGSAELLLCTHPEVLQPQDMDAECCTSFRMPKLFQQYLPETPVARDLMYRLELLSLA